MGCRGKRADPPKNRVFHAHAIAPFPVADAADAAIGRAAVAVVAKIVGQYVVAGVCRMFVLNDKVDFHGIDAGPGKAEMAGKAGAAHGQGVVENDEFVALVFGGDMPGFQRHAVVGRDNQALIIHALFIRRFENETAQRAKWFFFLLQRLGQAFF